MKKFWRLATYFLVFFIITEALRAWKMFLRGETETVKLGCMSMELAGLVLILILLQVLSVRIADVADFLPARWSPTVTVLCLASVVAFLIFKTWILELSGIWRRIAFVLLALLPVAPLRPGNFRFPAYRVGMVWRAGAVVLEWYPVAAAIVAGEWRIPTLGDFLVASAWWISVLVMVGIVIFLEYGIHWHQDAHRRKKTEFPATEGVNA